MKKIRLIDADALIAAMERGGTLTDYGRFKIEQAPTIDPESLRARGRWIGMQNGKAVCSNCNRFDSVDPMAAYCRYCGAKMTGGGIGQ